MHGKWWGAAGIAAAALMVTACGSSSSSSSSSAAAAPSASSSPAAASASVLKVTTIKGVKVLTNAQGMTLYFFAPDTSTKSACTTACLKFWPLVPAPATAGTGVTGTIGMIMTHGKEQATYDGHPLYTYIGDTAPGQAKGNDLNASGGLWWEATVSGTMPTSSSSSSSGSSSSSSGSSSGGYGY